MGIPPADLQFLWDGYDIFWHESGREDWLPLADAAQYPKFPGALTRLRRLPSFIVRSAIPNRAT